MIMIGKPKTVAIAAVLIAIATSGISVSAFAKDNQSPEFDACFTLAVERGSGPNKGGGTKEHSQHNAFMEQCMTGKIPLNSQANLSALTVPTNAHASTVTLKRINGLRTLAK
jgi:hypothetical protein